LLRLHVPSHFLPEVNLKLETGGLIFALFGHNLDLFVSGCDWDILPRLR